MASPPLRPSLYALGSWLLTLLVPRLAGRDADSIQPDRGNDADLHHGGRDLPDAADEEASKRSDPSFVLDSAVSHHATSDKRFLSEQPAAEGAAAVVFRRGGSELPVAGAGTVVVGEKFQLPHVLYAPALAPGTVLVSVQQLAAWGYLVMFGGGRCVVTDRSGGKVVGEGRLQEDDGLCYRLDFLNIPLDVAAADGADSTV